jgi:hypothetical protein
MALDETVLREHLNMTVAEAAGIDEAVLTRLLGAARAYTAAQLGFALDDAVEFPDGTPADVEQAVLMIAAHWFSEREAVAAGVTMMPVPFGYSEIIANHRRWTFG